MEKDCHDYEDKLFDLFNPLYFMNMIYLPFIDYCCNELERRRRWDENILGYRLLNLNTKHYIFIFKYIR